MPSVNEIHLFYSPPEGKSYYTEMFCAKKSVGEIEREKTESSLQRHVETVTNEVYGLLTFKCFYREVKMFRDRYPTIQYK